MRRRRRRKFLKSGSWCGGNGVWFAELVVGVCWNAVWRLPGSESERGERPCHVGDWRGEWCFGKRCSEEKGTSFGEVKKLGENCLGGGTCLDFETRLSILFVTARVLIPNKHQFFQTPTFFCPSAPELQHYRYIDSYSLNIRTGKRNPAFGQHSNRYIAEYGPFRLSIPQRWCWLGLTTVCR